MCVCVCVCVCLCVSAFENSFIESSENITATVFRGSDSCELTVGAYDNFIFSREAEGSISKGYFFTI